MATLEATRRLMARGDAALTQQLVGVVRMLLSKLQEQVRKEVAWLVGCLAVATRCFLPFCVSLHLLLHLHSRSLRLSPTLLSSPASPAASSSCLLSPCSLQRCSSCLLSSCLLSGGGECEPRTGVGPPGPHPDASEVREGYDHLGSETYPSSLRSGGCGARMKKLHSHSPHLHSHGTSFCSSFNVNWCLLQVP